MVRERDDLYITVPSLFRCPISLDVMKSPVSLCTGVTYDRSNIQRWLDGGNNTCPATMQVLQTKDLVPNHTLQRLIQIWSEAARRTQQTRRPPEPGHPNLARDQARQLAQRIIDANTADSSNPECISELIVFANESMENRKFLGAIDGFVPSLVEILRNSSNKDISLAERTVRFCNLILGEYKDKEKLVKLIIHEECLSTMLTILQRGILESRIAMARVLETIVAVNIEAKTSIAEYSDILSELLKLVSFELGQDAVDAGLSGLLCLAQQQRRTRVKLVRLGVVRVIGNMLSDPDPYPDLSISITEKMLKLLEMVSSCKEGREEICKDDKCVSAIVKKVLKVSNAATEHAVTILWSLCCLFRDSKAQETARENNGLGKVLLLMQSTCSAAVRQMAGDLLKVLSVNSKLSCLFSYDTKTTHIMPF